MIWFFEYNRPAYGCFFSATGFFNKYVSCFKGKFFNRFCIKIANCKM